MSKPQPSESTLSTVHGRRQRVRTVTFWTILVFFMLLVLDGSAFVMLQLVQRSSVGLLLWNPNLDAVKLSWEKNGARAAKELGWPLPDEADNGVRDPTGAKLNIDFPDTRGACLSAYGDSFIWGDEVPHKEGWIEQLSRRIGCRVSNFGVNGYGTDQAYLRFLRSETEKSKVVILGIFPDNIVRNVNQYRAFLGFGVEPFFVKGNFVVDRNQNLRWVTGPNLNAEAYVDLHRRPQKYLRHEYLLPDSPDGPVSVRFPYTFALIRAAISPRVLNRLRGRTPWAHFYTADHVSGAVPLTISIARAFVQEAERRGTRALILMLPSPGSFRSQAQYGASDYSPFLAEMKSNGLEVFDPMPALSALLQGESYCKLYANETSCGGHFGVHGGSKLAEVVAVELKRLGLLQ